MPEPPNGVARTVANLHRSVKPAADAVGSLLVDAFHYLALFAIGATIVWSAVAAFFDMAAKGRADLPEIILLFIYLELGAMIGIYFKPRYFPSVTWFISQLQRSVGCSSILRSPNIAQGSTF